MMHAMNRVSCRMYGMMMTHGSQKKRFGMGKRGGPGRGQGRKTKPADQRVPINGKIAVRISIDHAIKLQQLMLREWPNVKTPEQLVEYLIDNATQKEARA